MGVMESEVLKNFTVGLRGRTLTVIWRHMRARCMYDVCIAILYLISDLGVYGNG